MSDLLPDRAARPLLAAWMILLSLCGCGYSIRPPYDPGVHTVYVPIFKGVSFRRDLNLQLTEMLIKEIEKRTPFKVVGSPEGADSTLSGTITMADKNMLVENPNNLPRQIQATLFTTVQWTDNRTGVTTSKDLPPVAVVDNVAFFPELGETTQLGYYKAMNMMVEQIVSMMEQPWLQESTPIETLPE